MFDRQLPEFIKHLELGSKSLLMYSEKHPRTQAVIQQAYEELQKALESRDTFTISIAEGNLLLDGQLVEKGNPVIDRLSDNLFARNVHSLTFLKGITREELISLLSALNLKPQKISERGGFEQILEEGAVKNIQVNRVKYGIISEDEASLDPGILSDLLLAMQSLLSTDSEKTLAAAKFEKSLDTSSADPGALLFRIFHSVAERDASSSSDSGSEALKQRFAELFRSFTPALQAKVLLSAIQKSASTPNDPLNNFYRNLNENDLETSLLSLLDQPVDKMQLQDVFTILKHDPAIVLTEPVKQKLQEVGIEEPNKKLTLWEELLQKDALTPQDVESAPQALYQVLREEKFEEVDKLSKRIFQTLSLPRPELRMSAVHSLPRIIQTLSGYDRWKNLESSISFLLSTCYRKENAVEVFSALQSLLLDIFVKNYKAQKFSVCEELLRTFRSQTSKQELIKSKLAERLPLLREEFGAEISRKSEACEIAIQYIKLCGPAGAQFLFERLVEEEDRRSRANLISSIEFLDAQFTLAEIEKRVQDSRWYVVRNMITILGKMNIPETPSFLRSVALHPEPRVVKELIKNLYKSTSKTDTALIAQLLQHPDKSTRLQAVHLATRLEIQATAPQILAIARSANETDLRTACLQTLLQWKIVDAVPVAQVILGKKNPARVEMAERNTAVMILGQLQLPASRDILQRVAATDPNPETRNLAKSYL